MDEIILSVGHNVKCMVSGGFKTADLSKPTKVNEK